MGCMDESVETQTNHAGPLCHATHVAIPPCSGGGPSRSSLPHAATAWMYSVPPRRVRTRRARGLVLRAVLCTRL